MRLASDSANSLDKPMAVVRLLEVRRARTSPRFSRRWATIGPASQRQQAIVTPLQTVLRRIPHPCSSSPATPRQHPLPRGQPCRRRPRVSSTRMTHRHPVPAGRPGSPARQAPPTIPTASFFRSEQLRCRKLLPFPAPQAPLPNDQRSLSASLPTPSPAHHGHNHSSLCADLPPLHTRPRLPPSPHSNQPLSQARLRAPSAPCQRPWASRAALLQAPPRADPLPRPARPPPPPPTAKLATNAR